MFYQQEMHSWDISTPPDHSWSHNIVLPNTALSKCKTEHPHAPTYHTTQSSSRPSSAGRSVAAFWSSITVYDNLIHAYAVLSNHLLLAHLLYTRKNRHCTWKTWDWLLHVPLCFRQPKLPFLLGSTESQAGLQTAVPTCAAVLGSLQSSSLLGHLLASLTARTQESRRWWYRTCLKLHLAEVTPLKSAAPPLYTC